ncbi:alkaline phosphatase-like protein [Periconia macrospinosa]|uniref:Alkaline phosphatase-like protein n=1 Tax=Periconia macrospinosa TaxID=97972 RepID=A0A2V1CXY5_9PLEO|nr:alkaline phosphatase-like protein [Periconia macrospinosa]
MKRVLTSLSAFLFMLLVVAVCSSKTLHIWQHISSLRLLHLIIYLPTLFAQDAVTIFLAYRLLRSRHGAFSALLNIVGSILCTLLFVATAVQFGFYIETGFEVDWLTGIRFMRNPSSLRILMSGSASVYRAGAVMVSAALLFRISIHIARIRGYLLPQMMLKMSTPVNSTQGIQGRHLSVPLPIVGLFAIILLQWTRPAIPYDHLSDSIPLAVMKALHQVQTSRRSVRQKNDIPARDDLYGLTWADGQPLPGLDCWLDNRGEMGAVANLSDTYPSLCDRHRHRYKPLDDPLKISNLDLDLLLPLQQTFRESAISITHIVLLTLESTRKDVFPIRQSSPIYDRILRSQEEDQRETLDRMLARLTPVAQKVTGETFTPQPEVGPGRYMGGITVDGAVTDSTYTVKSLLGSHCGVSPMPYDFLTEIDCDIYQPCIPHILNLFNRVKGYSSSPNSEFDVGPTDVHSRSWTSAFLQSVESYDWEQDIEIKQMGFHTLIAAETLNNETAKHYPPKSPWLGYLGYAETEIKPYLRDIINDAVQSKKRLFLSHLTSTTHHPWDLPPSFAKKEYMGSHDGMDHTHLNNYLNTVHFADQWLGEVLNSLDEAGITNETLVVIVGDHGYPFPEDTEAWGVTGNPHITAFQVPLVFRHPHLPRIQVSANASSMSILPTILDLLIQSGSLDQDDITIASALIKQYQGQSLLRPFRNIHDDRQGWNLAIVASGGSLLAISSAAVPYRLVIPLVKGYEYRFTNLDIDPAEVQPLVAWSLDDLRTAVHDKYDPEASSWVDKAAEVGEWWLQEQDRLWNIHGE